MTTRENCGMPSKEGAFSLPLVTWTEKGLPPTLDAQTSHSSWESFGHKRGALPGGPSWDFNQVNTHVPVRGCPYHGLGVSG